MARSPKPGLLSERDTSEHSQVGAIYPAKERKRTAPNLDRGSGPSALHEENTIAPAKARERKARVKDPEPAAAPIVAKGELPSAIARRYNAQPGLFRRHIDYYEGAGAIRPAFRDRGSRLVAFQNDPTTVSSLIAIARHRGWTNLEVRGDDTFRREVWKEAQRLGIKVKGYRPRARDRDEAAKEALARTQNFKAPAHAGPRSSGRQQSTAAPLAPAAPLSAAKIQRPDFDVGVTGLLLDHGVASYRRKDGAPLTPFVRLDIGTPRPVEVWGIGLPAAIVAAKAKIGDTLTLRREGVDQVAIDGPSGLPRDVQRNRWSATAERSQASRSAKSPRTPDVAAAQAHLAVVQAVARAKLSNPKDQAKVTAAAKTRIAEHHAEGRSFKAPKDAEAKKARQRSGPGEAERPRGPERVRGR